MARKDTEDNIGSGERFLDGQMLIAMPGMADPRFSRSVIYLCAHSDDGAMGIIINQHASNINFIELLDQLNITSDEDAIHMPPSLQAIEVHLGGPVETGRGFVLHSTDYYLEDSTLPINDGVNLTATLDILRAIAAGNGPDKSLLALGYAGWAPGQLENEFQSNGWLHCPANQDVLFDSNIDMKYQRALEIIGIDPARLVNDSGHA